MPFGQAEKLLPAGCGDLMTEDGAQSCNNHEAGSGLV